MGSAAITVVANSPPSSGTLRITPSVGYALEDKFSVLANNWVDEDLPLKYTFKYIKDSTYSGGTEIALGASTPDALFATQLGLGGGDNNTITIVAYVQDSLGATTRVTQEIQVSQLVVAAKNQAAYLANKTSAVLAEASSGDPSTVLNTIMLTPATTKAVGNTISNLLDVDNSGSSKKLDETMTVTCNGTTYSGEAVCPCTHLTDFSTEVTQSLSLVTEHFMNVVTHEVTAKDVKQNLLLILVMAAFFFFYVVAVFYVNRWDRRDHRKTTRASRQIKRGSATPEKVKLSSLFQEPEYLQAKSWHSKLRAVVVGFGRSLKQNHKLLSIVFKYNESFSRAQRLTIVFTLVATQMFTNALLYRLRKGPKSLGSACISALITTVCMFPVGFLFMMMYKKAGRMQNYLIRFQVEDDAGNVVEVETDAYGNAREYSPAEQLSMDLATLARAWLFKCDECCEAQESNARVVVAKAQAELLSTEFQLKKLRTAIDNQFDRRISEAMAVEMNGPNVNDIIVKSRQSVRRVSRRPTSVIKAEQMVREDKRRITVTIKKEKQAILRTNQEKLVEKRKAIKKAKKVAAIEQHRLRREARLEQRKLLEGLRGIARLKKRLQLYLTAREERKVAALPLHERQVYLAEREQLKKIRRTSRMLYNAFLRRQPAHQSKPIFPEWVLFISYTVSAIWSAWCIYFVLMFAFTVGRVEAQLWVTSLLSGLALTYVIADPLKLFFRMGLMPMIATGILANSGFFNALTSEPMALGAVVVAAGCQDVPQVCGHHDAKVTSKAIVCSDLCPVRAAV
ncbi:hypothetical protein BBO99_00005484 [Phytophthora kernoviae]|uniref:REJ domain-containing protein n=2 Tax=Phytophthora kernoviae TaxID=325452 RepID=A0A3R7JTD4_9STRA|nr:hypothetical protein G195_006445 [Phytophthora kernoviae 00238/432]KAG2523133.1 hypothetical protein JM16_005376 [Phytophthora kernoviae]RLN20081.1 hypothetical protein BBI17_005560 [Phytophthora kernoviae]RLN79144.1 hypothetical protein BBO99_00005484 [Phytophthora kernoviae]